MKTLPLLLAGAVLLSAGCVSMIQKVIPPEGYKAEEVKKVRTVAIIAFQMEPYVASGAAGKLGGAIGSHIATAQAGANLKATESPVAEEVYQKVATRLSQGYKWKVLPAADVVRNPIYAELVKPKIEDAKQKLMGTTHVNKKIFVKGVAIPWNTKFIFSTAERQRIAKALNVDAVLIVGFRYFVHDDSFMNMGVLGQQKLTTTMFYYLFPTEGEDPIWFHNGYEYLSDESLGRVSGMEDQQKIDKLTPELAEELFAQFLKAHPAPAK